MPRAEATAAAPLSAPPEEVVATALALRGAPYRNGGSDPSGFDCSGLVWYIFAQHHVAVPRTVSAQFEAGRPVPATDLKPGDLVFFETAGAAASHVGLAIGDGLFLHAPSSRGQVRVERLSTRYWAARMIGVRRLP